MPPVNMRQSPDQKYYLVNTLFFANYFSINIKIKLVQHAARVTYFGKDNLCNMGLRQQYLQRH